MKIVIVGAGEVGFHIASRLARENKDVVIVDKDPEAIRRVTDSIDVQCIIGSGSSPIILEEAGITTTDILLAVTDSDETNLVACLVTKILSPTTKKLARLRNAEFDAYHDIFREKAPNIDTVINPEIEVVKTINRLMSVPGAVDVGEFAEGRIRFIGVHLDNGSPLTGVRLSEIHAHTKGPRPLIAAIVRDEQVIIPHGKDRLRAGDLIYFLSEKRYLSDMLALFGKKSEPIKRVLIIGGGQVGFRLAAGLEEKGVYTKIIEKNAQRCSVLAEKLNKTVILHGDGSDQGLLAEENVRDMDVVITLTNDEEINILVSLMIKRMGVSRVITRISKFSYFPLMSTIGIEQVVSPRLSAINTILQHIRKGRVLSDISIKGEQAEMLEAIALETSAIVGKPLRDISFPDGALIAAIIAQDRITIPTGDSIIEPNNRIIISARREAIPKVEKILTVKLEYF